MKPEKIIIISLIFLLLSIFNCGPSNNTTIEPRSYSIYMGKSTLTRLDLSNTSVGYMLTKLTGVTLEPQYMTTTDEKLEADFMTTSGVFPDIIYSYSGINIFARGGALIPLNDLIDKYGPNIKKYYGSLLNLFKNDDGIIYYIGNNYQTGGILYPSSGFWLPVELLRENNWPVITTASQYFGLIREFVKKHPTLKGKKTIGFTGVTDLNRLDTFIAPAAMMMGYPYQGDIYVPDTETMEAKLILAAPFSRDYFRILNNLWIEGLLDPQLFLQDYEQYLVKISSGRVIGYFDHHWQMTRAITHYKRMGQTEKQPVPFPVLFEGVENDHYNIIPEISVSTGVGISVDCKDPAGVIKFWNRMLEDDIQKLIYWGFDKLNYYSVEGKMQKTERHYRYLYNETVGTMRFITGFPQRDQYSSYDDGNPLTALTSPVFIKSRSSGKLSKVLKAYGINAFTDFFTPAIKVPYPTRFAFSPDAKDPIIEFKKNLTALSAQYISKAIKSSPGHFDTIWDDFQSELKRLKVQPYLDRRTQFIRNRQNKLKMEFSTEE